MLTDVRAAEGQVHVSREVPQHVGCGAVHRLARDTGRCRDRGWDRGRRWLVPLLRGLQKEKERDFG